MTVKIELTADEAYAALKAGAKEAKRYLTEQRNFMTQPTCSAGVPLQVIQYLGNAEAAIPPLLIPPGLPAYAQQLHGAPAYDIVAENNTMLSAITSAKNALIAMFPKDGNGFILYQTIQANGSLTIRTVTAAQLAAAVTQVDAVIAAIG